MLLHVAQSVYHHQGADDVYDECEQDREIVHDQNLLDVCALDYELEVSHRYQLGQGQRQNLPAPIHESLVHEIQKQRKVQRHHSDLEAAAQIQLQAPHIVEQERRDHEDGRC